MILLWLPLSRYWTMPEYKCYWRVLNPESKVALIFGPLAARRYGTDMTLSEGLQGRGDPYKTLLREGTTALLNSYNSLQFPYNSIGVVTHMNWALMSSTRGVLITALRFIRANSGSGRVTCKLAPCKWSLWSSLPQHSEFYISFYNSVIIMSFCYHFIMSSVIVNLEEGLSTHFLRIKLVGFKATIIIYC